jgi:uroporphyrinogen III methyltransferase/synthase
MSESNKQGVVYLVGAGPGDAGLITVRGASLLANAQVVVFDALADPRLLDYCPGAVRINAGKRAGDHVMSQAQINECLVREGLAGRRVVRLKGGDPFVFGRGGEECLALAEAGVRFEVVPGVTSGVAAAAYAGIPVTHRDLASSFTLITGHEKEDLTPDVGAAAASESAVDWSAVARLGSVAIYMGARSLDRICRRLLEHGMPGDMPAAIIQWGTTPRQRTVVSTLANLAREAAAAGIGSPAITLFSKVVTLRRSLNWFESRPLFGRTIVITRSRPQASELSTELTLLGARTIEAPMIELVAPTDFSRIDATVAAVGTYDWIVFTSANGVSFTRARLVAMGRDARIFASARIAAIGQATADAVGRELCLNVDRVPASSVAESLAEDLKSAGAISGRRFLLLRADIARPELPAALGAAGAAVVDDVPIYQTRPTASLPQELLDALAADQVDWIAFTSSSTVRNFQKLLGASTIPLGRAKLASIGPITSQTLAESGWTANVEANPHDIHGLVEAIVAAEKRN